MRGKNKKNEKVNKVEKAVKKVTDPIEKVGKEVVNGAVSYTHLWCEFRKLPTFIR